MAAGRRQGVQCAGPGRQALAIGGAGIAGQRPASGTARASGATARILRYLQPACRQAVAAIGKGRSRPRSYGHPAWPPPACSRARGLSATASRLSTGSTGTPMPPRAPKARPWATAHAVRSPVNDPGRAPNHGIQLSERESGLRQQSHMAGISVADAWAPPGPLCCPAPRAVLYGDGQGVGTGVEGKQVHGGHDYRLRAEPWWGGRHGSP